MAHNNQKRTFRYIYGQANEMSSYWNLTVSKAEGIIEGCPVVVAVNLSQSIGAEIAMVPRCSVKIARLRRTAEISYIEFRFVVSHKIAEKTPADLFYIALEWHLLQQRHSEEPWTQKAAESSRWGDVLEF